ncbi:MAG: hypothetical protein K1X36_04825 [Pyrinomonadaceae bacterium]|nr:hypothetical protein [Pyrinomonadaceae bacterium]
MKAEMRHKTTANKQIGSRPQTRGRTAVWQAKVVLLIMINLAQMWILSAAIESALANEHKQLWPLVIASLLCWAIALSLIVWWKPSARPGASRR